MKFASTPSLPPDQPADFSGLNVDDLVRLHELSTRLLRPCPLPELLDEVLRATMDLLSADFGNVQLFNRDVQMLEIVAQVGFGPEFLDHLRWVDHDNAACGAALRRTRRVVVVDTETDPLFESVRDLARRTGFRAVQSTPLRSSNGEMLGMLSTHFRAPRQPTELQLRLLDLYAQQAERVIERARAEESLRRRDRQLDLITSCAPVTLVHITRDLRFRFVNEAYARRFNLKPSDFIGRTLVDVHGEQVIAAARAHINRVLRGEAFETDMVVNYRQIGRRVLRTGWLPEFDEAGQVIGWVSAVTDITERADAEESLRRFQHVVENSTEFIGICDLQGRPSFINRAALRMIGLDSIDELARVTVKDFFFPEDQPFIEQTFFPRVLRDGSASVEIRFRHFKTGEALWMNYNVVVLEEAGRPVGYATISQNITERKLAEARLRESEDRNRTLVESLPLLVWTCDPSGVCDYLSPQWLRYTGLSAATQLGDGWVKQLHSDDAPRVLRAWNDAVRDGRNYNVEFRLRGADGVYRWFDTRALPLRNANGEIVKWFGTNTDIDERKRSEDRIREGRERLEAALTASRTGTFRWNIQTNELDWDAALDLLFGLQPGQTARSLSQFVALVHPDDRARVITACERCARQGADFHEEFRVVRPDGSIHWLDDQGKTFFGADLQPAYMTGACVDITARKKTEDDLREARNRLQLHAEQLESKVEERTASLTRAMAEIEEFSYSVSHDLRAPLRAMTQYARLLAEEFAEPLGERGLNYVQRIIRSSERMNQLTLDTLQLSKVSRGTISISPVCLDTLVADVINDNNALQGPAVTIALQSPLGVVNGHASLLTQAISNLLVNAVKFVPSGRKPEIRIWTEQVEGMTRLSVRDNGIGIAPEHQPRLFGIFERVHPTGTYEGTGIGLAIVRKATQRLGGSVGMTSDGVSGSTFWIQLPIGQG